MYTTVYRASPGQPAEQVVEILRRHGLSPYMLNDPNPDPFLSYAAKGTYSVRIAVPADQAKRAVRVLKEWDARGTEAVAVAARQLRRQIRRGFALGCAISVAGSLLFMRGSVAETLTIGVLLLVGGTVFGTVVVANVDEHRRRRRAARGPRCEACDYLLVGLTEPRCPECGQEFNPELLQRITELTRELKAGRFVPDSCAAPAYSFPFKRLFTALLALLVFDWGFLNSSRPALREETSDPGDDCDPANSNTP